MLRRSLTNSAALRYDTAVRPVRLPMLNDFVLCVDVNSLAARSTYLARQCDQTFQSMCARRHSPLRLLDGVRDRRDARRRKKSTSTIFDIILLRFNPVPRNYKQDVRNSPVPGHLRDKHGSLVHYFRHRLSTDWHLEGRSPARLQCVTKRFGSWKSGSRHTKRKHDWLSGIES